MRLRGAPARSRPTRLQRVTAQQDTGAGPLAGKRSLPVKLNFVWHLPRTGSTVPMAVRLPDNMLAMLDVTDECRADLALALTEACTNAVRHAELGDEYRLAIKV